MQFRAYSQIPEVYTLLSSSGRHAVECGSGPTDYFCGPGALSAYRERYGDEVVALFSDYGACGFRVSAHGKGVFSIGRADAHTRARRFAKEANVPYSTCPWPFANDCFATDRAGGSPNEAATPMGFPNAIILDWKPCIAECNCSHYLGLGEATGLLTSVRDYATHMENGSLDNLGSVVDPLIDDLFGRFRTPSQPTQADLAALGSFLAVKGLLIRLSGSNEIVAGCEHLVAYALQNSGVDWPHGRLVAAGVLLTLPLFPSFSEERVIRILAAFLSKGVITCENLRTMTGIGIKGLLHQASETRPLRPTVLRHISGKISDLVVSRFERLVRQYG